MADTLISILINNYNYAQFLREAIDSTLCQSYPHVEVIVVDDGSTDGSRDLISSYGSKLTAVFKKNGGQASAFNAGVAASRGDILCFLDSDDYFHPNKIARIAEVYRNLDPTKPLMVHHLLRICRTDMQPDPEELFGTIHDNPLNLAEYARKYKFLVYAASPTTGFSINRRMADLLFPIPENIGTSADCFIVYGASLVGELHHISDVLGGYRIHGNNHWFSRWSRQKIGKGGWSVEFIETLDRYLTQKLKENQLPGRISYSDSMHCWEDMALDGRWTKLAWKIAKANAAQHDRHTWGYTENICKQLSKLALGPLLYRFMKKHYRRIRAIPLDAEDVSHFAPWRFYLPR